MQGSRIGQYELQRILGQGAFGEVWLARDHRLGRAVAIKKLKVEVVGDPQVRRHFDREAETLIQISEPHVVHVLDRIEIAGVPALVTEYMEGGSIADLAKVRTGPFTVEEVARWAEHAALGLAAMHRRGILHRDIKPANLFLSRDGNLSIGDFGLARSVESTQTLGLQGTMPYMSPEQIRGLEMDARADLFSLGVALYEMLAGERPFGNGFDRSARPAAVRELRPDVPAYLSDAVDSLLETDLEKRTQTADELLSELRGIRPTHHRRRLKPRLLLALAPVIIAVGLALGKCWIPGAPWCVSGNCEFDPPPERRVAILPFEYRGDPQFARIADEIPRLVAERLDRVGRISAPLPDRFAACPIDPALFAEDSAEMRSWMESKGASLAVFGVVSELREQVRIDLSFRYQGTRGYLFDKRTLNLQAVDDALPAVNEVGLQVLTKLLIDTRDDTAREALIGCESFDAMCAFLQGLQNLRRRTWWTESLDHAVELDSTMAMAYYHRSWLADWNGEGPAVQRKYLRAARRHTDRLSSYGEGLLRAAELELEGDIDGAESTLTNLVAQNSNTPWAWLRLGYIHYTHNHARGRPWWDCRRELERVEALDEGNLLPELFLSFVRDAQGDVAYMRDVLTADRSKGGASTVAAFTFGAPAMRDSVLAAVGQGWCGQGFAPHNIYILVYPDNHRNIAEFMRAHICADDGQNPADRAWRSLVLAHVHAGMGEWAQAEAWFGEVPESFRPFQLEYKALAMSLPFIPVPDRELQDMIEELEHWSPRDDPPVVDPEQFGALEDRFNPHLRLHEHLREYCLAALQARAGDRDAAERSIARLESLATPPDVIDFVADLASMGRARIALSVGDHAGALAQLQRVRQISYASGGYSSFFSRADARYLRAECLVALGRSEESLGWYDAADQNREFQLIYSGMAHLRQAQACEALGRASDAIEHYRVFLDLYRESDPEYADLVALATDRLSVLEREG